MDKELGWVEGRWSKLDFSHKKVRGRGEEVEEEGWGSRRRRRGGENGKERNTSREIKKVSEK